MSKITVTAHSGCLGQPMDSIESVLEAIKIGADIAEVDINYYKGHAVLKHDKISHIDEELIKLVEVFKIIDTFDIKLNLDIKNKEAIEYIEEKAKEYKVLDKIFLTGIDENDALKLLNCKCKVKYLMNVEIDSILDTKEIIDEYINHAKRTNSLGLNIDYNYCTKQLVESAHENNLTVSVWTVDKIEDINNMIEIGVDNITTNRPDFIIKNNKVFK